MSHLCVVLHFLIFSIVNTDFSLEELTGNTLNTINLQSLNLYSLPSDENNLVYSLIFELIKPVQAKWCQQCKGIPTPSDSISVSGNSRLGPIGIHSDTQKSIPLPIPSVTMEFFLNVFH